MKTYLSENCLFTLLNTFGYINWYRSVSTLEVIMISEQSIHFRRIDYVEMRFNKFIVAISAFLFKNSVIILTKIVLHNEYDSISIQTVQRVISNEL